MISTDIAQVSFLFALSTKVAVRRCSSKLQPRRFKNFEIFTRKHLCWSLLIRLQVKTCNFIKKTPTQLFSCEYEILENIFYKTHSVAASVSICLCGTLVYWLRLEFSVSQSHFVKIEN